MITKREVAKWILSKELRDTSVIEEQSPDERGRPYIISPMGTKIKRVLIAGSVASKNILENYTKITLSDPLGTFFLSAFATDFSLEVKDAADALSVGDNIAVVGRVSPFKTDEGILRISIMPESIFSAAEDTINYWNWRTLFITRRKYYAIQEMRKREKPDIESLVKLGYSPEEAECAANSLKYYQDYNLQEFMESLSSVTRVSHASERLDSLRDLVLRVIKEQDDGKGCRYESLVEAAAEENFEQSEVDEALNDLGSSGDIYEVSLKRYKII